MIRLRGQSYGVRIPDGHGGQRWVGSFKFKDHGGKKGAHKAAKLAELQGMNRAISETTLGEWCSHWLEDYRDRVKRSSFDRARHAVNMVLRSEIAHQPLANLDVLACERWARSHRPSCQTASTILNAAVARGLAPRNPFRGMARKGPGRRDLDPLTVEDVTRLADAAGQVHDGNFGRTMNGLVIFAAYTGLRFGECAGLEWRDIDLDRQRVSVRRNLSAGRLDTPKTPSSLGESVLLDEVIQALERLPNGSSTDPVFRAKRGGRLSLSLMSGCYWPPVVVKYGAPVQFHELRHFCGHHLFVTLDLPARVVAAQLRHATPKEVLQLYGHFRVGALDDIERALGRKPARLSVVRGENA